MLRRPVPSVTQYASPSLIAAISYGGHPRRDDPRWRETGAPTLDAYEAWSVRWCGMACLRMALLARDGTAPTLYELATGAAGFGAYVDDPGAPEGLIYRPFVAYAAAHHALDAETITRLDGDRLRAELDRGHLVIASVHPEIRRPWIDPPHRGGHLVLVTHHDESSVTLHDPAGHTPEAVVATLGLDVFARFSAGRGIALHLGGRTEATPYATVPTTRA
ncbi:C39 family peptidase [Pimelobacter simplex]|uniref:C39 family peptidase n=1 Tax=Nocardioides simplex TaxID=2045 RepID=UPI003671BFEA